MACDLEPTGNFLFGYSSCTLPQSMIDIHIIVHTLKGIHTSRKDQSIQISRYSPWGMEVNLFPSLQKKIKEYIEECQAIVNPFTHISYPSWHNSSLFAKRTKATPVKRSNMVARCHIEKLSKPRKVNMGYHPNFFLVEFACPSQGIRSHIPGSHIYPTSCISSHTHSANHSIHYVHTASHSSSSAYQPTVTLPDQSQKSPGYCAICTPTRKQCPTKYSMPLKSHLSDSEKEEKDSNEQEEEEELGDWNSDM